MIDEELIREEFEKTNNLAISKLIEWNEDSGRYVSKRTDDNIELMANLAYSNFRGGFISKFDLESVVNGWRLIEKGNCYHLANGNDLVATLSGPYAERNAIIIAGALQRSEQFFGVVKEQTLKQAWEKHQSSLKQNETEKPLLGLYKKTFSLHYDGGEYSMYQQLLAIDSSAENLRDRWNRKQKQQCIEYGYDDPSYFKHINPVFKDGLELKYQGSTGGGFAGIEYEISIEEFQHWDRKETI